MERKNAITRYPLSTRSRICAVLLVCVVLCAMAGTATAGDKGSPATLHQGNYAIGRYVVASGGTLGALSAHYIHLGTAGQAVVDACESSNNLLRSGIWQLWALPTGVAPPDAPAVPTTYMLYQNFPNPFNPRTLIRFDIPVSSFASLVVMNVLGQEVACLASERKEPGSYQIQFDASTLSSGVYFYRLHAGDFVQTRKLMLVR
jgi:hypothetical protein